MSSDFLIFFHAYVVTFDCPGWKCVALKREKGKNEGVKMKECQPFKSLEVTSARVGGAYNSGGKYNNNGYLFSTSLRSKAAISHKSTDPLNSEDFLHFLTLAPTSWEQGTPGMA